MRHKHDSEEVTFAVERGSSGELQCKGETVNAGNRRLERGIKRPEDRELALTA